MAQKCIVCPDQRAASEIAKVFDDTGIEVSLRLCRDHDIELYKAGQIKFMAKYNVRLNRPNSEKSESEDPLTGDLV